MQLGTHQATSGLRDVLWHEILQNDFWQRALL
jgi:hypothetical protein